MSCCGNKRAQWSRTEKQVLERATPVQTWSDLPQVDRDAPAGIPAPRLFEYLGNSSLVVVGAGTRQRYHFACPGHRLEIAYEDSFAIMAEMELKRV
jgi:hypothetical protein